MPVDREHAPIGRFDKKSMPKGSPKEPRDAFRYAQHSKLRERPVSVFEITEHQESRSRLEGIPAIADQCSQTSLSLAATILLNGPITASFLGNPDFEGFRFCGGRTHQIG